MVQNYLKTYVNLYHDSKLFIHQQMHKYTSDMFWCSHTIFRECIVRAC